MQLRTLKPVILAGVQLEPGAVFDLDDAPALQLIRAGEAEPADDGAKKRASAFRA